MLKRSSGQWSRWWSAVGLALLGWGLFPLLVWGQAVSPVVRDRFLSDPELTDPRDPLLPVLPVVRPLSPLEKSELAVALDQLAAEAEQNYGLGETDLAFEQWMREVRLRRILGYGPEIAAMQRVGLRAWENARSQETQLLTLRLRQIQTDLLAQDPLDITTLEAVAATFEVLRDIDSAIAVYETLIVRAAQAGNQAERQRLLESLATLQENWFRFAVAGKTYQSLLSSPGSADPMKRAQYLQGVIRNYQDAGQLRTTLDYQQRLLAHYEETGQPLLIPALTLAIARNYRDLDDLPQARTYYQATYTTALAQRQSNIARDAVQDLIDLYRDLNRPEDVRYLFQQKLAVERLSYDGYGLMQTFGDLGQFYESQNDPESAIAAYQEALILARHLGHREIYFTHRLQRLLLDQGRLTIIPAETHQGSPAGPLRPNNAWEGNGRDPLPQKIEPNTEHQPD